MQFVRENFFRGEEFADLADAQRRVEQWCATTAGLRLHGTTAQRPAEHFAVKATLQQIAKDKRLIDTNQVNDIEWHFFASGRSGSRR